ncbi:MAG TPA: lipase family protein [Actinomycetes bacterium]
MSTTVRQRLARHPSPAAANRRATLVAAARRGLAWLWPAAQAERRPPAAGSRPSPAADVVRRLLARLPSAAGHDPRPTRQRSTPATGANRPRGWFEPATPVDRRRRLADLWSTHGARGGLAWLRSHVPADPGRRIAQLGAGLAAKAREGLAGLWPALPAVWGRPAARRPPPAEGERRWRLGTRRVAAVAVVLAVCAAMAVWSTGESSASTPEFPPAAFYQVPDPLPAPAGQPGQLIRALEIKGPATTPGARAWVVVYHSRSQDGRDVAVSGLVVAPPGGRPGPRPVVAWAHPTTGLADRCTPSHLGVDGIATLRGYWLGELLRRGYVVVATDYEGLGTPGLHPYLVGASEAHSVLDAVRAAGRLRGARAGGPVALWGFSEGGHAVLWAGELATTYAPELQLAGVASVSPGGALEAMDRDPFWPTPVPTTSFAMLIAAAWHDTYGAPLDVLTAAGRAAVERLRDFCPPSAANTPPALREDPRTVPAWRALFERNAAAQAPIPAPVLFAQGGAEGAASLRVVTRMTRRLCGFGDPTALRVYAGVHHGQVVDASGEDVLAWLDARLAGRPASGCGPATEVAAAPRRSGTRRGAATSPGVTSPAR